MDIKTKIKSSKERLKERLVKVRSKCKHNNVYTKGPTERGMNITIVICKDCGEYTQPRAVLNTPYVSITEINKILEKYSV